MPGRFSRATLKALSFPVIAMKCPPYSYLTPYPQMRHGFLWVGANPHERDKTNIVQKVSILKGFPEHQRTNANMKLAEGVGFEPTIRFPVYTLSKRAPSATRPSLRARETRNITRHPQHTTRAKPSASTRWCCQK